MAQAAGPRFRLYWGDHEVALAEGEHILGRVDEATTAWLESESVSRRHARILIAAGQATLEDLGSKNGTFLGGQRLSSPAPLTDGDEIRLGLVRMTFRTLSGGTSTKTSPKT